MVTCFSNKQTSKREKKKIPRCSERGSSSIGHERILFTLASALTAALAEVPRVEKIARYLILPRWATRSLNIDSRTQNLLNKIQSVS